MTTFPLPRFWYFPGDHKAVVVATGDDHANGGTAARFDTYLAADPAGCSTTDWTCFRFSSYVYPQAPLSNAAAAAYDQQDFEIGLHPNNGCRNFTSAQDLRTTYANDLASWRAKYSSLPSPVSNRFHCLVWSDWASQFTVQQENGIRFDVNYYYWPGSWVNDRPGFMTGSGMPQRFADADGTMADVYQAATQMTDESGQSYPFTSDTLLDRALGSEGYYGYFVANMHTDLPTIQQDTALLSSARARGVPVVAARDVLEFIDGRNQSSFQDLAWNTNELTFRIAVADGANNLTSHGADRRPRRDGSHRDPQRHHTGHVPEKHRQGNRVRRVPRHGCRLHGATYAAPQAAPLIMSALSTVDEDQSAVIEWSTDLPASSTVVYGTAAGDLNSAAVEEGSAGTHRIELSELESDETYYYRVISEDLDGSRSTWPAESEPPATIEMPADDTSAPSIEKLTITARADGTALVRWQTDEPADSTVTVRDADGKTVAEMYGADALEVHTVVVTGLDSNTTYDAAITSEDAAGNRSVPSVRRFTSQRAGVADYMAASQRVGTLTGALRDRRRRQWFRARSRSATASKPPARRTTVGGACSSHVHSTPASGCHGTPSTGRPPRVRSPIPWW